jgi:hypothetical protein
VGTGARRGRALQPSAEASLDLIVVGLGVLAPQVLAHHPLRQIVELERGSDPVYDRAIFGCRHAAILSQFGAQLLLQIVEDMEVVIARSTPR